jgi:outer membrane protein OmpA-like peptidoglycan-associated protein
MRLSVFIVLLLTIIWGVSSWKWYTCNIKGLCNIEVAETDGKTTEKIFPNIVTEPTAPVKIDLDSDHDGITDKDEQLLGTDPKKLDSDSDGFSDRKEIGRNISAARDTDGDGIIDALDEDDDNDSLLTRDEVLLATSAYIADSDNDGLLDNYEVGSEFQYPLDSDNDGIINAVDYDDDNDGIPTLSERADPNLDGNPLDAVDSDSDGIVDYLDANFDIDRDQDGLTNELEVTLGTNPDNVDTDGDGINDAEEIGDDFSHPSDLNNNGLIDALEAYVYVLPKTTEYVAPKQVELVIEQEQRARVHFPFNNAESPILSTETENYFADLVKKLRAGSTVKLTGHTDNVGDEKINQKLGLARAEMIRNLLIKQGAPANSIQIESQGELEPLQSNNTELGRGTNRRVELVTNRK